MVNVLIICKMKEIICDQQQSGGISWFLFSYSHPNNSPGCYLDEWPLRALSQVDACTWTSDSQAPGQVPSKCTNSDFHYKLHLFGRFCVSQKVKQLWVTYFPYLTQSVSMVFALWRKLPLTAWDVIKFSRYLDKWKLYQVYQLHVLCIYMRHISPE